MQYSTLVEQVKDQLLALMTDLVDLPPEGEHLRPALLQQRQQLVAERQRLEGSLPATTPLGTPSASHRPLQGSTHTPGAHHRFPYAPFACTSTFTAPCYHDEVFLPSLSMTVETLPFYTSWLCLLPIMCC